jgi:hypothetical protein
MPRRVGLLAASIAILLALCLPATTLAYKGINYSREETFCTGLQAHLKVKFWAAGNTSATKLTVDSFAQRAPAGVAWTTI